LNAANERILHLTQKVQQGRFDDTARNEEKEDNQEDY
jgi:hypothetical protein